MSDTALPPAQPARLLPPRRRLASLRAIMALVLREMSSSYGSSPGSYAWAVLEPAAGIALLSLVFAAAFMAPPLGGSFPTFYATGMLPFVMFGSLQSKVALSLLYSKQLLAYPTVTFVDAIVARFVLTLITELLVAYLILTGCLLLFEGRTRPNLPVIVEGFALTALLGLGVGVLLCFLFSRFPVTQRAWSILMRPMFIISGVFLLFEAIPQPYRDWLWWNPLVHVIGLVRRGFYPTYDAPYVSVTYVVLVSLACMVLGLIFLRRHYRDFLSNS